MTDEGKYIRKLRGDRKRNTQKKVRRWVRAVNEEKMPMKKFNEKYGAYFSIGYSISKHFLCNMSYLNNDSFFRMVHRHICPVTINA